MENKNNKILSYREFYGKKSSDINEEHNHFDNSSPGIGLEKDDVDDTELKYDDGSMKIPRVRGMVGLAKIIQVGKPTSGKCADGAVSGMTKVGGHAEDKITAAGMVDKSVASHSVGGDVVSGEGQKQGGSNSSGKIDGTPKEISATADGQGGPNSSGKIDGTPKLQESHVNLIKTLVREVLDEMTLEEGDKCPCTGDPKFACDCPPECECKCHEKDVDECHSMKVVAPTQARVQKDDHARSVQTEPNMTE